MPSLRSRLAAVLAAAVVLGGLEAASRAYIQRREIQSQEQVTRMYPPGAPLLLSIDKDLDYRFIPFFTADPKLISHPDYRFDGHGFRLDARAIGIDGKPGFKLIWMLGASVVEGLGLKGDETISAYLNGLFERSGKRWRVVNLGQTSYTSTLELLLVLELLQDGYKPDAILTFDGATELPLPEAWRKFGFPEWQRNHSPKARQIYDMQNGVPTFLSSLRMMSASLRNSTKIPEAARALLGRRPGAGAPAGGRVWEGGNWDEAVRRYLVALAMIHAAALAGRIPSFHFFQPLMEYEDHYHLRAFSPHEIEYLKPAMFANEHLRREALYSARFRDLRMELGKDFYDLYDVFKGLDGETLYADPRHLTARGCQRAAQRIFQSLGRLD